MSTTFSTSLRFALLADGEDSLTWGQLTNTNWQLDEQSIAGFASVSCSGNSDVTLTASNGASDQSRNMRVKLTGALTGNINVIVPTASKMTYFDNQTSGSFTVTAKTASGTGVLLKQGFVTGTFCDGTNVVDNVQNIPTLVSDNFTSAGVTISGGTIDAGTF